MPLGSAGGAAAGAGEVYTRSIGGGIASQQARASLKAASISCRGQPVVLQGGPLLEPFSKNFTGAFRP